MRLRNIISAFALAALASSSFGQTKAADHLVISEVGHAMPAGCEFTEIYNPTANEIDLTNYYIADHNRYFDLPSIAAGQTGNTLANGSDHMRKFPDGAKIPSGGVVVVCVQGEAFINMLFNGDKSTFDNLPGNPQLFETDPSRADVQDMGTNLNKWSPDYPYPNDVPPSDQNATSANNLNHTDAGEAAVLFYWDGQSSLVKDADMMQYLPVGEDWGGSSNQIAIKGGLPEIGPGSEGLQTYPPEAGTPDSLTVRYTHLDIKESGKTTRDENRSVVYTGSFIRRTLLEPGEIQTGGAGITGHDATSELINLSFMLAKGHLTGTSPGVVDFGLASQNQKPVIGNATRDIQYPAPGNTVTITVPIYDEGNVTAKLMVDKGTGYSAVNMTKMAGTDNYTGTISLSGVAEGTAVRYYVTATDTGGLTSNEADWKPALVDYDQFPGYHTFAVRATNFQSGDFIISEVMANPQGANNYDHPQYLELYNPGTKALDVSGVVLRSDFVDSHDVQIPYGVKIPAKDFIVITGNKNLFMSYYPGIDSKRVVDVRIFPSISFIGHGTTNVRFFSPNEFDYNSTPVDNSTAFKTFTYYNNANGWPNMATDQPAGNNGYSIELKTMTAAAEGVGTEWGTGTVYNGTPMAYNSIDTTARPGNVTVVSVNRDLAFPTPAQQITFTADVNSSVPIADAKLYIKAGNAATFTATNMTSTDGITFTATAGPFPDKTLVRYYVQATDTSGNKGAFPFTAPVTYTPFWVYNVQPLGNQVVVSEMMFDPYGTDNTTYPEFVEFYNKSAEAVDLSYMFVGYNENKTLNNNAATRVLPEGIVIQPHDFFILGGEGRMFNDFYVYDYNSYFNQRIGGPIRPDQTYNLAWSKGSKLPNPLTAAGGTPPTYGTAIFSLPNTVDFAGKGETVDPVYTITYSLDSPWAGNGVAPSKLSYEINNVNLDPNQPTSWHLSLIGGSPTYISPEEATVADWTVY